MIFFSRSGTLSLSLQTIRFKTEMVRNITIKLGYANSKIYKCTNPECPRPGCYRALGSSTPDVIYCESDTCKDKKIPMELQRHVSFVVRCITASSSSSS